MGIGAKAPRGGIREDLAGAPRVLILRNDEIERFEDEHRGAFEVLEAFSAGPFAPRGSVPTVAECRDLVALGLIGGGMEGAAADSLVAALGPDQNRRLQAMAHALLGVAFYPDASEDLDAPEDPEDKKKVPAGGMSGG